MNDIQMSTEPRSRRIKKIIMKKPLNIQYTRTLKHHTLAICSRQTSSKVYKYLYKHFLQLDDYTKDYKATKRFYATFQKLDEDGFEFNVETGVVVPKTFVGEGNITKGEISPGQIAILKYAGSLIQMVMMGMRFMSQVRSSHYNIDGPLSMIFPDYTHLQKKWFKKRVIDVVYSIPVKQFLQETELVLQLFYDFEKRESKKRIHLFIRGGNFSLLYKKINSSRYGSFITDRESGAFHPSSITLEMKNKYTIGVWYDFTYSPAYMYLKKYDICLSVFMSHPGTSALLH